MHQTETLLRRQLRVLHVAFPLEEHDEQAWGRRGCTSRCSSASARSSWPTAGVLTFTGSLSVAESGRAEIAAMLVGALGVFLLVFLSTLPVVVPFLFMHDAKAALRVSNAIAVGMLFLTGYAFGRTAGHWPWLMGISMVALGSALVGITIALGG